MGRIDGIQHPHARGVKRAGAELAAGLVAQALTNRTMAYTEKMDAQIEATSLAEVNAAIRKALDPAKFLYVYAGDFVAAAKK